MNAEEGERPAELSRKCHCPLNPFFLRSVKGVLVVGFDA